MPSNDNNSTAIPDEFKTFLEWKSIVVDSFADLDGRTVAFVKPATGSVGVVLDRVDGKSWSQIAGKTFGTVLDAWVVSKVGKFFKATTYVKKIRNNVAEGGAVWEIGKSDFSAARVIPPFSTASKSRIRPHGPPSA